MSDNFVVAAGRAVEDAIGCESEKSITPASIRMRPMHGPTSYPSTSTCPGPGRSVGPT